MKNGATIWCPVEIAFTSDESKAFITIFGCGSLDQYFLDYKILGSISSNKDLYSILYCTSAILHFILLPP